MQLAKAEDAVYESMLGKGLLKAMLHIREKALKEAQIEVSITTLGIKQLEEAYALFPNWENETALRNAKNLRKQRIAQSQGKNQAHTPSDPSVFQYSRSSLLLAGDTLPVSPKTDLQTSIKASSEWTHTLSDDEFLAIQDYTGTSYKYINSYLTTPNHVSGYVGDPEEMEAKMALMDSALSKHVPNGNTVTLWRTQKLYDATNGDPEVPNSANIEKTFPQGGIYTGNGYHSTSIDPSKVISTSRSSVNLEILSKNAVPLTATSKHGADEAEFLIPRGTKFEVVSNNTEVFTADGDKIRLIQLREL